MVRVVQHLTYCSMSNNTYNTASNKTRLSKLMVTELFTTILRMLGRHQNSVWGMCLGRLPGIHAVRTKVLMRLPITKKHVSRTYDGSMSAKSICDGIKHFPYHRAKNHCESVDSRSTESEGKIKKQWSFWAIKKRIHNGHQGGRYSKHHNFFTSTPILKILIIKTDEKPSKCHQKWWQSHNQTSFSEWFLLRI